MPRKTADGYQVDIRPQGRNGPRFRKHFGTQGEALAYERYIASKHGEPKPWEPQKPDARRLTDLISVWYDLHGQELKRGEARKTYLENLATELGNPRGKDFTANTFATFRKERLKTVTPNTANHDLAYLRALFNELARLGEWHSTNPLAKVRRIKTDDAELSYLELDEIKTLLAALDSCEGSQARITARLCLSTGARWSEAATLKRSQLKNGKVIYSATKNGKLRAIPIDKKLQDLILENMPLIDGYSTFKRVMAELDFDLPSGQLSHVLRHTFASHFVINGGNLLSLQRILGHASLAMTMRYAHLAPDHFEDALNFNPLSTL